MKYIKFVIVAVILIVIIVLLNLYGRPSGTIKIGALYPLTGGLASYGEPAKNIAMLAVDDINADGGIKGRKLELVIADHKCDPKEAVSAFEKLTGSDGVHVLTSVACTGTVLSIAPQLEAKDAVLLGTITSGSKLTGVSPNFFRNWASDRQESRLLADEIIKKGYKNIAAINEETDYAKGLVLSLQEFLQGHGVKLTAESFASNSTDVRSQLTKITALKPDLIFVSVQTVTTGEMILTQMEQLKFQPKAMFVSDNILKSQSVLTAHAALLENAMGGDYVIVANDKLNSVLAKYKSRYGADCPQLNLCAAEYDAIQLIADALKAKGDSASGVRDYLSSAKFDGVSGSISFDNKNDRSNANYSLFEIKAGKAAPVND